MTENELVAEILEREGGYVDHPSDKGGPTAYGITARTWGAYLGVGRAATREDVQAITEAQAAQFYLTQYVKASPFRVIGYEPLRVQMIDYAVLSGQERAIRWLQRVLDVPVTSALDDRTKAALARDRGQLVNNALVAARVKMFREIVAKDALQRVFLDGWTNRALGFLYV